MLRNDFILTYGLKMLSIVITICNNYTHYIINRLFFQVVMSHHNS